MEDKKNLLKNIATDLEDGCKVESERRYNTRTNIISIVSLCTSLILAVFVIPKILLLYRDFYTLKDELMQQKKLLTFLHENNDKIDSFDSLGIDNSVDQIQVDIINRYRRSDGPQRVDRRSNNNNNNRRRHNNNQRRNSNNRNTPIKALHLDIDMQHPRRDRNEDELKTGNRFEAIPYWKISDHDFNYDQSFAELHTTGGYITIQEAGLYLIYSQMTYFDRSGRWSHVITIGETPFIKCLASEWGIDTDPDTGLHYNTIHQCYTSAVTHIEENKKIYLRGMYPDRVIHEDKDLTFWGIVKLS